jgi:hypothetical protein
MARSLEAAFPGTGLSLSGFVRMDLAALVCRLKGSSFSVRRLEFLVGLPCLVCLVQRESHTVELAT